VQTTPPGGPVVVTALVAWDGLAIVAEAAKPANASTSNKTRSFAPFRPRSKVPIFRSTATTLPLEASSPTKMLRPARYFSNPLC
jgi:hypothetical protein